MKNQKEKKMEDELDSLEWSTGKRVSQNQGSLREQAHNREYSISGFRLWSPISERYLLRLSRHEGPLLRSA